MKRIRVKVLRDNEQQVKEEFVLKEKKVYVPKNEELMIEIIQVHYDVLVAGYRGRWKIIELVTRNYWWLEVTKDIGKYVDEYDLCQRMKNRIEALAGKQIVNNVLKKAIDALDGILYHQVAIGSRKECDIGSM